MPAKAQRRRFPAEYRLRILKQADACKKPGELGALLRREGRVATRAELLDEVWRYEADVVSRTVDVHILELRRKLETDPAQPRHILTVRKTGYRLVREPRD